MIRIIWIACLLSLFFACEKEKTTFNSIPEGTYTGTFQRDYGMTDTNIAAVSITFNGNKWLGTGEFPKYPALCHGTYSLNGDTIIFVNECGWTAEFDWSLILSGKYLITESNEKLEFFRMNGFDNWSTIDKYKLTKVNE